MAKRTKSPTEHPLKPQHERTVRVLRVDEESTLETPVDDAGLSLDDLGQAYAAVLNRGAVPYEGEPSETAENPALDNGESTSDEPLPTPASDIDCDLSPQSILEAMLFVGHPQGEP